MGAIIAATLVVRARHRASPAGSPASEKGASGPVMATSRVRRGLVVARVTSRVGTGYVADATRSVVSSPERAAEQRGQRQLRTAAEVVETLGSMKGAFMKLGQMASYLDAGLPPEVRKTLATLQADAPPMTAELAASVVTDELGGAPEDLFAEWDPVPLAAASIGQVHRAVTHHGQAVAVKVQYPGIDDAIRSDLDNSTMLINLVRMAFPGLDTPALVNELRSRIVEELDYSLEARNQTVFAEHFAGHPFIHIPRVIVPLSARRVLTTELATGARYDEVVESWSQGERDLAGETIFRFVFGCLYRFRVFNGDPHPGNYLFSGDGRVSFLDFGLVKWFSDDDVVVLARMVRTMVTDPDPVAFRAAIEKAGFLRPGTDLTNEAIVDYFRHYYELVLSRGPSSFSPEYASETLRHFFDANNPVIKAANIPAPFVILQRINLGLYAVLAGLGSVADWRSVADEIWPFVGAPPSTRLGHLEEAWRARPA
ncbi:MAG: AarF/ABC1/UbiB kinase family protein [Actinomycetota bacterium]|nr:AarF/ABC1/UbiB kinase family protein [Actinomycetota bacterium]